MEVIKGGGSIATVAIRHVGVQLEGTHVHVVWRSLENLSTSAVRLKMPNIGMRAR